VTFCSTSSRTHKTQESVRSVSWPVCPASSIQEGPLLHMSDSHSSVYQSERRLSCHLLGSIHKCQRWARVWVAVSHSPCTRASKALYTHTQCSQKGVHPDRQPLGPSRLLNEIQPKPCHGVHTFAPSPYRIPTFCWRSPFPKALKP